MHQRQRDYARRDDPIRVFRRSQAWIKTAKKVMAAGPRCCALCGTTQALTVDHIIPLTRCFGSGLEVDPGNLRILCVSCQNKTAARWRASFSGGPD
jgi:5-methylcytosine-specific restriction endonuclease McrA